MSFDLRMRMRWEGEIVSSTVSPGYHWIVMEDRHAVTHSISMIVKLRF